MSQDNNKNDSSQISGDSCSSQNANGCCSCGGAGGARWFWLILIALIAILYFKSGQPLHVPENWTSDLVAARQTAIAQNKNILIAFHTSWCNPCNRMKADVYPTEAFQKYAAANLVLVMLDGDTEADAMDKYQVSGFPTYILESPDGKVLKSFSGYMDVQSFISAISVTRP